MKKEKNRTDKRFLCLLGLGLLLIWSGGGISEAQEYGNEWYNGDITAETFLRQVVWTGSQFVAASNDGIVYKSTNGTTWTKVTTPFGSSEHLFAIGFDGSNTLVAPGRDGKILYSTNGGNSWIIASNGSGSEDLYTAAYGNETWVVTGELGTIWTSPDAVNWTKTASGKAIRCNAFGNGYFMMGTTTGEILRSTDGVSLTAVFKTGTALRGMAYGNGMWLAAGRTIATSANGTSWTVRVNLSAYNIVDQLYAAGTAPNSFIVSGEHGLMLNSSDGVVWRKCDTGSKRFLTGIAYGNNVLVAVGNGGKRPGMSDALYLYSSHYSPQGGTPPPPLGEPTNTIRLIAPNGGERLNPGTQYLVKWTGSITYDTIDLEYYNGTAWVVIVNGTADDGSYEWTVPDVTTSQARLRIQGWHSTGNATDYTDSTFTIGSGSSGPTITIKSPNGGETLIGGTTYTVKWQSSITLDSVDIEYFNGTQWEEIIAGTEDDGSYDWIVPSGVSTTGARLWIKGFHTAGNPVDFTDSTFTILPPGGAAVINILTPNGGEILIGKTTYVIRWQSSIAFDRVDIEYYNGTQWVVIVDGTQDDGSYEWIVPNISTNQSRIRIQGWSSTENPADYSDGIFTIIPGPSGKITLISPNGGESWEKSSTQNITWTSSGEVGNVKISYSTDGGFNWTMLVSSTTNDGTYAWLLPGINANNCLVKITDVTNALISDISNSKFSIGSPSALVLSKSKFNFGGLINNPAPPTQTLFISGGGGMKWKVAADVSWLILSPSSGSGGGIVTIAINQIGLALGQYTGTITISAEGVSNSPQTAAVNLNIIHPPDEQPPFGDFSTPIDETAGVVGAIPVTGWALDDIGVVSVKLYRVVDGTLPYVGDAVFVEGARPDVEAAYPDYPKSSAAGWGYMLLTNFLPDGVTVLKVIITDTTGREVDLGTKTITIDNAHSAKPFGTIDNPAQGGSASGSNYRNIGWALTPQPDKIPENGSTLNVYIDGVFIGKAAYNLYRSDIAALFPGYRNSNGATGYRDIDMTAYSNGVHAINWTVTDNAGNSEGLGARYFLIQNLGGTGRESGINSVIDIPVDELKPIRLKRGYNRQGESEALYPPENGIIDVEARELDRIELQLGGVVDAGNLRTDNGDKPLPIGSTLDTRQGIFYWQLGPGFLGTYELEFTVIDETGKLMRKLARVTVKPFTDGPGPRKTFNKAQEPANSDL